MPMGFQEIQAAPKKGNPVFQVQQAAGEMTAVHRAARQDDSSQRQVASIAFSSSHRLSLYAGGVIDAGQGRSESAGFEAHTESDRIAWKTVSGNGLDRALREGPTQ